MKGFFKGVYELFPSHALNSTVSLVHIVGQNIGQKWDIILQFSHRKRRQWEMR